MDTRIEKIEDTTKEVPKRFWSKMDTNGNKPAEDEKIENESTGGRTVVINEAIRASSKAEKYRTSASSF